jgi:hypothetical protein
MVSLETEAGGLKIERAAIVDYDAVMAILREAAAWLSARGIPQWPRSTVAAHSTVVIPARGCRARNPEAR